MGAGLVEGFGVTSTFGSFDASPLGARVQSSVDANAFGEGQQTVTAELIVALQSDTNVGPFTTFVYCTSGPESLWDRYGLIGSATPPQSTWVTTYHRFNFRVDDGGLKTAIAAGVLTNTSTCAATPSITLTGRTSGAVLTIASHQISTDGEVADTGEAFAGTTNGTSTSVNDQPWIWSMTPEPDDAAGGDVWSIDIQYPAAPAAEALSKFADWVDGEIVDAVLTY